MTERLGIPYAYALETSSGYGVRCPFCGLVFHGVDESQQSDEDAISKGSSALYARHYAETHMATGEHFDGNASVDRWFRTALVQNVEQPVRDGNGRIVARGVESCEVEEGYAPEGATVIEWHGDIPEAWDIVDWLDGEASLEQIRARVAQEAAK